ncbi:MAG TPA: phosphate ABC transporter permease subunit PstC, partial [Alphaproteobacteria bacterium]|nr:phosphate ABC transporter permease subunit PstC [Alphaproteobacteria bacterium]
MNSFSLAIAVLLISSGYFFLGTRALTANRAAGARLHSLPHYYGLFAGLMAALPALALLTVLAIGDDIVFNQLALGFVPDAVKAGETYKEVIVLAQISNVVNGINFGEQPDWVYEAAEAWAGWQATSTTLKTITALALSLLGGLFAYRMLNPSFRSRNAVERILMTVLAASSAIAILTTVGIVFSVIFESLRFFALVPVSEFLFGLTWNPQFEGAERAGSGQMGLATYGSVPLFAGTLLISVVALSVSVPV